MPSHTAELACDRTASRRARGWVLDVLRTSPPSPPLDDAHEFDLLLVTSELVNASLLAGAQRMTLQLTVDPGVVRVAVEDDTAVPGDRRLPAVQAQRQCLRVIDSISSQWAMEPTPDGRTAWAEFRSA